MSGTLIIPEGTATTTLAIVEFFIDLFLRKKQGFPFRVSVLSSHGVLPWLPRGIAGM